MKIFLSLAISSIFCLVSYRVRWLTFSGSLAASLFGWSLLYFGGIAWILPIVFFFGSSSLMSKIGRQTRHGPVKTDDIRNARQVFANGGLAWLFLLVNNFYPDPSWYAGFTGAIAAATADTWGTELGRLFQGTTRSVTTGKIVPQGVSGGISWQGTLGGGVGAGLIAGIAAYFLKPDGFTATHIILIITFTLSGIGGSLLDSLLGATLQVRYKDTSTGLLCEDDAQGLIHFSGIKWMTNNAVNLLCTAAGSLIALLIFNLLAEI